MAARFANPPAATSSRILATSQYEYAHALADQRRAAATYDRELGRTLERYNLTIPKE